MYWTGRAREGKSIAGYFLKKSFHLGKPAAITTWDNWNKKSGEHCSTRHLWQPNRTTKIGLIANIANKKLAKLTKMVKRVLEGNISVEKRQTNKMCFPLKMGWVGRGGQKLHQLHSYIFPSTII